MDHDDPVIPIDPDLDPSDPAEPTVFPPRGLSRPGHHQHRARPGLLSAISVGGMVGASARYGLARLLPTSPGRFPWATFWTNLSGSFLLGLLLVAILERFPTGRHLRPFAATGVLGAFTTMSTYEVETALLLKDGHAVTAVLYLGTSLAAGLALAYAGIVAGRRIVRHEAAAPSAP
jgi:CrcB protein